MSISHYEFDNANVNGNKEAVIIPNAPTLVNKLSAHETNGIRDKINELVDATNPLTPIQFLELRLKFKGDGNTAGTLQTGDIVHGFADATTIWTNARYEGGDINDRDNYTPIIDQYKTIVTTGKLLIFKIPSNLNPLILEVGDVVQGVVENAKIEGVYLGGDASLLASFTIYSQIDL